MKNKFLVIYFILIVCLALTACSFVNTNLNNNSNNTSGVQSEVADSQSAPIGAEMGDNNESTQDGQEQASDSSSAVQQEEPEIAQSYTTTLEDIKAKGTLVIGVDEYFAPMSSKDSTGAYVGFDIDLAKAICSSIGVQAEFKSIDMSQKENLLNSGEIDCVLSGLAITNERQQSMNLTSSYLVSILSVLTTPEHEVRSDSDLAGLTIGIPQNSTAHEVIKGLSLYSSIESEIKFYANYNDVLAAIEKNEIDCIIVDEVYYNDKIKTMTTTLFPTPMDFGDIYYTIGLRKADIELYKQIDTILSELKNDGTLSEISIKWLGTDVSVT